MQLYEVLAEHVIAGRGTTNNEWDICRLVWETIFHIDVLEQNIIKVRFSEQHRDI